MQSIKDIQLPNRSISAAHPPFIIAELSGNHNQSIDRAIKLVEAAAQTGVHAVKLQTYTAETMTLDIAEGEFFIENAKSLWKGESLFSLYKKAFTPWEWHEAIFKRCEELGLIAFSTPFTEIAVDFLEKLKVPIYKIASFENAHLPLIKRVAETKKPIIISTGLATLAELDESVRTIRNTADNDICMLKCTSSYPASPVDSNLRTIPHLQQLFNTHVGLSDHTLGIGASVASIAFGACVIERHFTLDRSEGGVDAAFSLEPAEMKQLVAETERAWQALGTVQYGGTSAEEQNKCYRRSLYISEDMKAGDKFTETNLRVIRPGFGLAPKYYEMLIGKEVTRDAKKGTALSWDLVLADK
jgi:pseudaminic acid synthase